jgi:hypothetical protein
LAPNDWIELPETENIFENVDFFGLIYENPSFTVQKNMTLDFQSRPGGGGPSTQAFWMGGAEHPSRAISKPFYLVSQKNFGCARHFFWGGSQTTHPSQGSQNF